MTTKTRTAQTTHGDIEYQTVECSSCGQETRKEDAKRFIIGDVSRRREKRFNKYDDWRIYRDGQRTGWACPYCTDEGPIKYPQSERRANWRTEWLGLIWADFRDGALGVWRDPSLADVLFVLAFVLLVAVFLTAVGALL